MKNETKLRNAWRCVARTGLIAAVILVGSWGSAISDGALDGAKSQSRHVKPNDDPERTARVFTRKVLREAIRSGPSFEFNTMMTALPDWDSPAYADILVDPQDNFLPCQGGPFALCYYSGPEGPLPCDASKHDAVSECECIEIAYGTYYVDINAILDVDTYLQTVEYCGQSGENCHRKNSAPVCTIINANKLFPGADLISVFSFACAEEQNIGQTSCPKSVYAGCMTAPCYREDGDDSGTVQCLCPNFDGPYQVGQDLADPKQCFLGKRNVWSASYNINAKGSAGGMGEVDRTVTFPTPDGCVPDDPNPDVACPLWPVETTLTSESELCQLACQEYAQCTSNQIELGFTCDATLCTSGCNDQGLVRQACSGLNPIACQLNTIAQVEEMAECSCCASQICGCQPDAATDEAIFVLNEQQREVGITPQCDINGTLCGAPPQQP